MRAVRFAFVLSCVLGCTSAKNEAGASADAGPPWREVLSTPGDGVAFTKDSLYVAKSASIVFYPCSNPNPANCRASESLKNGKVVRYSLDLAGRPTVIASSLDVEAGLFNVIADYAFFGTDTVMSLADQTVRKLPADRDTNWWGMAVDDEATYVRSFRPAFIRMTSEGTSEIPITETTTSSAREFAVDGDFLYVASECLTPRGRNTSSSVVTCPQSGIYRLPKTGGTPEPVHIVGGEVGRIAVRGSDLYYTVGYDIYHVTIGSTEPPTVLDHGLVKIMGLVPTDDGVVISKYYGSTIPTDLVFVPRDGSRVELIASFTDETGSSCDVPRVSGNLVACAVIKNTPSEYGGSTANAASEVHVFRRRR